MSGKNQFNKFENQLVDRIASGEIGVVPTDTIYGLVCDATKPTAVERIYEICKRDLNKPFIVVISKISDLDLFGVSLEESTKKIIKRYWPDEISIVLKCDGEKFKYLHRGSQTIAFRLPKEKNFLNFLRKTGPLVATSANRQGKAQANSITEANMYFGDDVDFYVDRGRIANKTSTLIGISNNKIKILREGSVKIKNSLQNERNFCNQ